MEGEESVELLTISLLKKVNYPKPYRGNNSAISNDLCSLVILLALLLKHTSHNPSAMVEVPTRKVLLFYLKQENVFVLE